MIKLQAGESGYFSKPDQYLDPYLFDGEHLKDNVRTRINDLLFTYLSKHYSKPELWTMVWLAGSGISYQWGAARGNGDLDVLFGLDYDEFINRNPNYAYSTREEIAEYIDNDLKKNLWPDTSHEFFTLGRNNDIWRKGLGGEDSGQYYEVTFFLNDNVEAKPFSIVNIKPYAAYNLTTDKWTVRPNKQPVSAFPAEFDRQANDNLDVVNTLARRFNRLNTDLIFSAPGKPEYINAQTQIKNIQSQARTLFDSIHLGRKAAFQPGGEGYEDFYNYQWQRAKRDGLVNTLNQILNGE